MLKSLALTAVLSLSVIHTAHAAGRPGGEGGGGRIGKVCGSDYLTKPEQDDCVAKMQGAQNDAERQEIRDLIRQVVKAREKDASIRRDNMNAGGPRR